MAKTLSSKKKNTPKPEMPAQDRAPAIWEESKRTANASDIARQLKDEGYGVIAPSTIRQWKFKDAWDVTAGLTQATTLEEIVTFDDLAAALRKGGAVGALKNIEWIKRRDPATMENADALVVDKISMSMIEHSALLYDKVIARMQTVKDNAIAGLTGQGQQGQMIEGEFQRIEPPSVNSLDTAVAAYSRAAGQRR